MSAGRDAFDMVVTRYRFQDRSGYIVGPETAGQTWLAIGRSVRSPALSWSDPWPHRHTASEELYIPIQGQMRLLIAEAQRTLRSKEVLMVRAGVPHAVTSVTGPLEHFGMRAPNLPDKKQAGDLPPLEPAAERGGAAKPGG
ncbi:MAG: cupin domain-containing protein [Anaerolineales bacterium]|nr:cupin domain-containing protein [Anaerolineales bacterium]